jgi:hypothetical protein
MGPHLIFRVNDDPASSARACHCLELTAISIEKCPPLAATFNALSHLPGMRAKMSEACWRSLVKEKSAQVHW